MRLFISRTRGALRVAAAFSIITSAVVAVSTSVGAETRDTPGTEGSARVGVAAYPFDRVLDVSWTLPTPAATARGTGSARVALPVKVGLALTTAIQLHHVRVVLSASGPIDLERTRLIPTGVLAAGRRMRLQVPLIVDRGGSGSVVAHVRARDAFGISVATEVELDVATAGSRVAISLQGSLSASVLALGLERRHLGTARYERALVRITGAGATQRISRGRVQHGALAPKNTVVSGEIEYKASDGSIHPSRTIIVELRDSYGTPAGTVLAQQTTSVAGKFSFTVSTLRTNRQPRKLFIRALAQGEGFIVTPFGFTTPQHIDSSRVVATGAPMTIDLTANNVADNNTSFDVADTMVTAVQYSKRINGGAVFSKLRVSFPNKNGTNFTRTGIAQILKSDRFDWDVILHEFGHYVAQKLKIDTSPGGNHTFGENLGETYGKGPGIRLAWSEGFATWFAITSEHVEGVAAMHIPHAGDTFYDDTEERNPFHVDLATDNGLKGHGEDDELSVARALWHINYDAKIAMSDTLMISTLKAAGADTLSKAVAALLPAGGAAPFDDSAPVDPAKVKHSNDFACVLTDQSVAPKLTAPPDGTTAVADTPLTYTWKPNGAGPSNRLNSFRVQFWSPAWGKLLFQSPTQTATSYTPSATDWKTLMSTPDETGAMPATMHVVVKGTGTNAPSTGPYKGCAITEPIKPVIKAVPIEPVLASLPSAPACTGKFPSDLNEFTLTGVHLQASTAYHLKFSDPTTGYPDIPLSDVTAAVNGLVGPTTVAIPIMPAESKWPLIATPPSGPTVSTTISVTWTSCLVATSSGGSVDATWGGAGPKPGSTVTEKWNGALPQTATPDAMGSYVGSYTITCPMASNVVTIDATVFNASGTQEVTFPGVACTPGARPRPAVVSVAVHGP